MNAEVQEPPLYQQLANRLRDGIEQAGLPVGSRLPSVRVLARQHGVSVMTALQALRWLETLGEIEARPRSGYFVIRPIEEPAPSRAHRWRDPLPELDAQTRDHLAIVGEPCKVRLDLAVGDTEFYPVERFNVLLRRLAYQNPDLVGAHARGVGYPALRAEIARRAMQYACTLDPDELVVTNGCIEALNLALRAVTRPGDVVVVETPTYFVLTQMMRALDLRPLPVPCRFGAGMDLAALKEALASAPVKAVVTIANGNNPVGSVMSDPAKAELIELLRERDIPLIEDDIFGDVCFSETRPRPVKSFDDRGNVLLCSSFSKSLCPGLRLGWISAGRFAERVRALKYTTSMATAELPQAAVAQMLSSGSYAQHLRRLGKTLRWQHRLLREAVLRCFPEGTRVSLPAGGYVVWIQLPEGRSGSISTRAMFTQARSEGISFAPGHLFGMGDGEYDNCLRLNVGFRWTAELESAVERLGVLARG